LTDNEIIARYKPFGAVNKRQQTGGTLPSPRPLPLYKDILACAEKGEHHVHADDHS
jgi:hypothetical protein